MGVNLSHRPLGQSNVKYGGYSGQVSGKIVDHNLSHEETPRYEISVSLRRSRATCDRVEREMSAPVWMKDRPSLVERLRGETTEEVRRPLTPLVADALDEVFSEIDSLAASAGRDHGDEDTSASEVAERVVSEWDFEEAEQ